MMYTYEYSCESCGHGWTVIDDYPPFECPECESESIIQIWKARAYD